MHRLFVAIDPPFAVKDALVAMMGGVIGARWQSEDQLHLTLRFIGEVDTRTANAIAEVLGTIRHPAFDIQPHRVGTFERKGASTRCGWGWSRRSRCGRCTTRSTAR